MIITTTHDVQGSTINSYLGIVVGESIIATNIMRDIMARVRDVVGGRSGAYEEKMQEARDIAMAEMPSKKFWSLSVWEDERKLADFRTKTPHKDAMVELRPDDTGTKFTAVRWKISGSAVPLSFTDAFEHRDAD